MIIPLHVIPKAAKSQIIGWVADASGKRALKVRIAAAPEDGKANAALVKFLSKQWDVPARDLELVSGESSRHKRLKIHNEALCERLMAGMS